MNDFLTGLITKRQSGQSQETGAHKENWLKLHEIQYLSKITGLTATPLSALTQF